MANGEKGKGRSQNQRLKLLYLLDYLLENTDETHAPDDFFEESFTKLWMVASSTPSACICET